jgi:hypothetical protein
MPVGEIGSDDTPMDGIVSAAFVPGHGVLVASRRDHAVFLFAPADKLIRRMGRAGRGPGEFQGGSAAWWYRGDSVLVFEGGATRRLSVFSSDGKFARQWLVRPVDSLRGTIIPLGADDRGRIFARTSTIRVPAVAERIDSAQSALVEFDAEWTKARYITWLQDARWFIGAGRKTAQLMFSAYPRVSHRGGQLVAADTDKPEYSQFIIQSGTKRIVRWPQAPAAVTESDIQNERDRRIADERRLLEGAPLPLATRFVEGGVKPGLDAMPKPSHFPAVGSVVLDERGYVWAFSYLPPADSGRRTIAAQVFDSTGRWLGRADLPAGVMPLDIAGGQLLGLVADSLGVQRLVLHRVNRKQ